MFKERIKIATPGRVIYSLMFKLYSLIVLTLGRLSSSHNHLPLINNETSGRISYICVCI